MCNYQLFNKIPTWLRISIRWTPKYFCGLYQVVYQFVDHVGFYLQESTCVITFAFSFWGVNFPKQMISIKSVRNVVSVTCSQLKISLCIRLHPAAYKNKAQSELCTKRWRIAWCFSITVSLCSRHFLWSHSAFNFFW